MRSQFLESPRLGRFGRRGGVASPYETDAAFSLLDPSTVTSGTRVTQSYGGTSRTVYCDGTDWRDEADDSVVLWWLPYGCVGHFDFDNNRFWWDGSTRVLGDLTSHGGDQYSLRADQLNTAFSGFSVMLDVDLPTGALDTVSGVLFGWKNDNGKENFIRLATVDSAGFLQQRAQLSRRGPISTTIAPFIDVNGGNAVLNGHLRMVASVEVGAPPRAVSNLGLLDDTGADVTDAFEPETVFPSLFGDLLFNRDFDGVSPTGATIGAVSIWGGPTSDSDMYAMSEGARPAFHFLGDSFLTNRYLVDKFRALLPHDDYAVTQDGVGGTDLTQQRIRWLLRPEFFHRALFIVDGALELLGDGEAVGELTTITAALGHDKWAYVQANPINPFDETEYAALIAAHPADWQDQVLDPLDYPDSDYRRIDHHNAMVAVRAFCGAAHFVETNEAMMAAGDSSPEDNAQIAKGCWPASKTGDLTHATSSGQDVIAAQMKAFSAAQGWE